MQSIRNLIPNALTLGNLACGFTGIYFALYAHFNDNAQYFAVVALCVAGSALLDLFDGMTARLLKSTSVIGKDLDSLADGVSFGVLPGMLALALFHRRGLHEIWIGLPFVLALFIPLASVLRLARFNHDPRQSSDFYGMATPFYGILWTGMAWLFYDESVWATMVLWFCWPALLANIRLFSLKSLGATRNNKRTFPIWVLFFVIAAPALVYFGRAWGLATILPLYIICSQLHFRTLK